MRNLWETEISNYEPSKMTTLWAIENKATIPLVTIHLFIKSTKLLFAGKHLKFYYNYLINTTATKNSYSINMKLYLLFRLKLYLVRFVNV